MLTHRLRLLVLLFAGLAGCANERPRRPPPPPPPPPPAAPAAESNEVTSDDFEAGLSPYGEWIEVDGTGRVWRPYGAVVGADFVPYSTGGAWVYSDEGWYFQSRYAWGWGPYHYGRWSYGPAYGWVWTPGTVWAPAWVEWRYGGGFVGWAPMTPAGVVVYQTQQRFVFVESAHFVETDVHRYVVTQTRYQAAYQATHAAPSNAAHGGQAWKGGPPVDHIAAATQKAVPRISNARAASQPPSSVARANANSSRSQRSQAISGANAARPEHSQPSTGGSRAFTPSPRQPAPPPPPAWKKKKRKL